MKTFFSLIIVIFACTSASVSQASHNAPRLDSCKFISLIVNKGADAGIKKVADMFSWKKGFSSQVPNVLSVMKNYKYDGGKAYIVAEFGNFSEQHIVLLSTKENGIFYLHFLFEKVNGELAFMNITFNDSYSKMTNSSGPFPQVPVEIDCGLL